MRILLRRRAGHGDVLSLTSVIPGLRKKYPGAEIYFQTGKSYDQLILHDPRIAGILWYDHPRPPETKPFDLSIGGSHGRNWGKETWMYLAQCRSVGVESNLPQIYLLPEEVQAAGGSDVVMANKLPLIGGRSYRHMARLAESLVYLGYHVKQIDDSPLLCEGVDNSPLTIRQAAAEVARARCVVTVDTVFLHVGVMLGKSMVAIFNQVQRTGPRSQYVPDCWIADWLQGPEEIVPMVEHLLGDGPAPDAENTFDPAYKESQP